MERVPAFALPAFGLHLRFCSDCVEQGDGLEHVRNVDQQGRFLAWLCSFWHGRGIDWPDLERWYIAYQS